MIEVTEIPQSELRTPPAPEEKLAFGKIFSNYMYSMSYTPAKSWYDMKIGKFENFSISPAAFVLHYAQEIFEGLKAYRWTDGSIALFRPRDNFIRMNNSAERLCLPQFDVETALSALKELIKLDADWVPSKQGSSLYIRPTMIAVDPFIGLRPAEEILFYIICSPVEAYLPGVNSILIEDEYVRAVRGGTGAVKTGGNYAASLYPCKLANDKGYDQILWLDAIERKYIEECGGMNVFFVYENCIATPHLSGSILPGITRNSILQLAKSWGIETVEGKLNINDVVEDMKSGAIIEAFATGTAAVISPIGRFGYKGEDYAVGDGKTMGALTKRFYDTVTGIQYGRVKDEFGWIEKV
jgi:branched-chain amino acid aminotransferase